uniref:Protein regulator of cytokinesis 1 n=1 Tax=Plectus sambesii TaxID=2011161 RepID=A0A914X5S4_9BILA
MSTNLLSRRRSVATATSVFTDKLHNTLEQLHHLWDEAGMTDEIRGERVAAFYKHLGDLLDDMLVSERNMVDELRLTVTRYSKEIKALCSELQLKSELTAIDNLELIERVDALRHEKKRLESLKKERLNRLAELRPRDEKLCGQLDTVPYAIFEQVPSEAELLKMAEHVAQMDRLLESRHADFQEIKVELQRLLKRMRRQATDQLALTALNNEHAFVFSEENMDTLRTIVEQTREEYKEYVSNFRERFQAVESELFSWRDKCLLSERSSEQPLPPFDEDSISESLIETYLAEVHRLKIYFEERQDVLGKLDEWKALWEEKLEHDRKEKDPMRFHNRACNLDRELKRRRHVENVLLPQAKKGVQEAVARWTELHPDSPILVQGLEPITFIDLTIHEYVETRELEKEQKHEQKKRQLMAESRFGAIPISPGKRPPGHIAQASMLKRMKTPVAERSPLKSLQQKQIRSSPAKTPHRPIASQKRQQLAVDPPCSVYSYNHLTVSLRLLS